MGKQTKETYIELRRRAGLEVVFFRSILPWYVSFLKFVLASYEGLVRIDDLSVLPEVFLKLVHQSMAGVYFVDARFERELVREASARRPQDDLGTKADVSYAYYVVDADNAEAKTGIVEIVSYGVETPSDLTPT